MRRNPEKGKEREKTERDGKEKGGTVRVQTKISRGTIKLLRR